MEICSSSRIGSVTRVVRLGLCTNQSRRLVVRGRDLSCEVETCRARRRLVARGGDLSCDADTCRARQRLVERGIDLSCEGSSSGKLVRDAAVWPRAGRLASEGLDEDLHAFPEMQHQVKGGLLLDVVVSKGTTILELLASKQLTLPRGFRFRRCLRRIILPSKGALIRALVSRPCGGLIDVPTSKRPQIINVQYPRIPSKVSKGTSHEEFLCSGRNDQW
jgi:hypothetical protein